MVENSGDGNGLGKGSGRTVTIVGAASSIGIRPYDDGQEARRLDRAPDVLRGHGLVERLNAVDLGDVAPPAYRDFIRPTGGVRNELGLVEYSRALADRVARGVGDGRFALVLGGDCSIILGCLLGVRGRGRIGLAYVDGHADFASPGESRTGSAASMCLALAVGRGDSPLATLSGAAPLVREDDVVLMGRRDVGQPYGHTGLASSRVLDLPDAVWSATGGSGVAAVALERLAGPDLDGFWIHVDADVLTPRVMPAVDSPEAGGPDVDELERLLEPLVEHPAALGMQLTIYDPALDPDGACAGLLVGLLERVLAPSAAGAHR